MNQQTDLHADGYVLLKNAMSQDDVQYALSCDLGDGKVDYVKMRRFIETKFFAGIRRNLDAITDPHYVKFRFSNNNNAKDAALIHGDIYNHTNLPVIPIFTCLCYFDDAQMELIPKSHILNTTASSSQAFDRRIQLVLGRGDALVFHSNIQHRGVNYNAAENRRLLQVFDVFPDAATYARHAPKLVIVKTYYATTFNEKVFTPMILFMSKHPNLTYFHYILVNNDLQYKVLGMDLEPWNKRGKYVSYEAGKRIMFEDLPEDGVGEINVNIICDTKVFSRAESNFYLYIYLAVAAIVFLTVYYYRNLDLKRGTSGSASGSGSSGSASGSGTSIRGRTSRARSVSTRLR